MSSSGNISNDSRRVTFEEKFISIILSGLGIFLRMVRFSIYSMCRWVIKTLALGSPEMLFRRLTICSNRLGSNIREASRVIPIVLERLHPTLFHPYKISLDMINKIRESNWLTKNGISLARKCKCQKLFHSVQVIQTLSSNLAEPILRPQIFTS